jgi:hypothetical protein
MSTGFSTVTVRQQVRVPSMGKFLERYPHYSAIRDEEAFLWAVVMTGDNFVAAAAASSVGVPAVAVVADAVAAACTARRVPLSGYRRQISGALMCSLMLANDHRPTGKKRAVGRPGWNRGETYQSG